MGLRVCSGGSFETKVSSPENRCPVTRPSVAAIFLDAAPRRASKRADSGRNRISSGTSAAERRRPAAARSASRTGESGIRPRSRSAAEPRLNPVNMIVIISERLRRGAYSDRSVEALGIAAPMPIPARKRRIAISVGDDAPGGRERQQSPKMRTETTRTGFRPNRSDDGPGHQGADRRGRTGRR